MRRILVAVTVDVSVNICESFHIGRTDLIVMEFQDQDWCIATGLAADAAVYFFCGATAPLPPVPAGWFDS